MYLIDKFLRQIPKLHLDLALTPIILNFKPYNQIAVLYTKNYYGGRRSIQEDRDGSARASFQHESPQNSSKAGVVITSFRQSQRR